MADLQWFRELHRRCTTPPDDVPLIERLWQAPYEEAPAAAEGQWSPDEADVEALMGEAERLITPSQGTLLFRTCRHYERWWEWLPWEEVSRSNKNCLRGDFAPYILVRTGGRVVAKRFGVWYFDYKTGGEDLRFRFSSYYDDS